MESLNHILYFIINFYSLVAVMVGFGHHLFLKQLYWTHLALGYVHFNIWQLYGGWMYISALIKGYFIFGYYQLFCIFYRIFIWKLILNFQNGIDSELIWLFYLILRQSLLFMSNYAFEATVFEKVLGSRSFKCLIIWSGLCCWWISAVVIRIIALDSDLEWIWFIVFIFLVIQLFCFLCGCTVSKIWDITSPGLRRLLSQPQNVTLVPDWLLTSKLRYALIC